MYVENRRYSVLALIFRIIGLIAIITSLFLRLESFIKV